jgi:hypothetical protein
VTLRSAIIASPDETFSDLAWAAEQRFRDGEALLSSRRHTAAVYLHGLAAEMWLKLASAKLLGLAPSATVVGFLNPVRRWMRLNATNVECESFHSLLFWPSISDTDGWFLAIHYLPHWQVSFGIMWGTACSRIGRSKSVTGPFCLRRPTLGVCTMTRSGSDRIGSSFGDDMPVRQMNTARSLEYDALVQKLVAEWKSGNSLNPQPVILEERDRRSSLVHVYVIWDEWAAVDRVMRSEIIMDAAEKHLPANEVDNITIAMGLTADEAKRMGIQ